MRETILACLRVGSPCRLDRLQSAIGKSPAKTHDTLRALANEGQVVIYSNRCRLWVRIADLQPAPDLSQPFIPASILK